jgi:O-antigen ligase
VLAVFCLVAHGVVYARKISHYFVGALKGLTIALAGFAIAYCLPLTRNLVTEGVQRIFANEVVANTGNAVDSGEAVVDLERAWTFEQGWEAFIEHPVLGIGYNNIGKRVEENYGAPVVSHNILLTLIAESGWPAFVIFIVLISGFFKRVWWARRNREETDRGFHTACMISMMAALLSAMAHPLLGFPLFYVILGFGHAAMRDRSALAQISHLTRVPLLGPTSGLNVQTVIGDRL